MTTTVEVPTTERSTFLEEVEKRLHHGNAPVAIALTDLDRFAELNRAHGREVGDAALAAWYRALQANLGDAGTAFRLGGDEFAVLLAGMSAENALVLVEEIRSHFSAKPAKGVPTTVTASIGIAANPPHGTTAEELWRAAGEALMRAKRDGSNRTSLYVEEKMTLKSNYYSKANLERLAKLSNATDRTEASLLREALDDLLDKYRGEL